MFAARSCLTFKETNKELGAPLLGPQDSRIDVGDFHRLPQGKKGSPTSGRKRHTGMTRLASRAMRHRPSGSLRKMLMA